MRSDSGIGLTRILELKGFASDEIGVLSNLSWTKLCASLPELIRIEMWPELGALEIRVYMDEHSKAKVGSLNALIDNLPVWGTPDEGAVSQIKTCARTAAAGGPLGKI